MKPRSVVLIAALLVAGCGTEPGVRAVPPTDNVLTGRTFLSTTVTENGAARPLVAGTTVSLWVTDDGRLVANAGCNTMQGPVDTSGGRLSAADLSMTEMGCDAARHAQDDWVAKLLGAEPSWRLAGDTLTVESGTTTITLRDKKAVQPDLALEGRRWQLDTIVTGDTASHGDVYRKAFLEFADGRVTGSTGCNRLFGPATLDGHTITFGAIGTTRMACGSELAPVEAAVVATLRGKVTFTVDGTSLSLKRDNSHALTFSSR